MRTKVSERGTRGKDSVRAVERAVELLFCLAEQDGTLSLQQLAQRVGCSKSTAHRLLVTMERLQVVEQDERSRQYRLGRRLRQLIRKSWEVPDLRQAALPVMLELRDRTDETVTLHLVDGSEHVVIEQCESRQEIRRSLPIGQRIPLFIGATARAILAFMPPEQARSILAQTRAASPDSGAGPTMEELQEVRRLGYSFSLAERVAGGSAISAPIFDRLGRVCAAISVSGPSFRFTPERAAGCAPALIAAAQKISAALGYTGGARHTD